MIATLAVLTTLLASAPPEPAPASPRIELITMGAGGYLYSYWGHSALRVIDPRDKSDVAYNYGGIEWGEGMFVRMMRGYVQAYMFTTPFAEVLAGYSGEDRTITRRTLALPPEVATQLADHLKAQQTETRSYYAYHHFYDNCTTRVADELDRALGGELRELGRGRAAGTYRSRVLRPVRSHQLLYVALDLAYSSSVDRELTEYEATFLGPGLEALIDRATVGNKRLVSGSSDLFRSIGFDEDTIWTWPWVTVYVLLLAPLCLLALWKPRAVLRVYGLFGLLGVLFVVLWIGSTYDFFRGNWNVLVFPPTHLLLTFGRSRWRARFGALYLRVHLALLLLLLVLAQAGVITQAIGPALGFALPLAAVLTVRVTR